MEELVERSFMKDEIKIIVASCIGTVFEWYDFILFGALAPVIGRLFFSKTDQTTGLIFALLAFSAGFIIRPFGALVFGRIGDMIGRKYTFLVTILIMGLATFILGLLPTSDTIGIAAPVILITLRMLQGLAVGGEYGGAAVFVAEHSLPQHRGTTTAWIQTAGTFGFILALFTILVTRTMTGEVAFASWGWRVPFLISIFLLAISVWMRVNMRETPVFLKMQAEGSTSRAPLTEAFARWGNLKLVLLAFVLSAGFGAVGYTSQFYTLIFLTQTLKVSSVTANIVVLLALLFATPFFVLFGWISDKVGRKPVILTGIFLGALAFLPGFRALTHFGNPALEQALRNSPVTVIADPKDCHFQFNPTGTAKFTSSCDIATAQLAAASIGYASRDGAPGAATIVNIGSKDIRAPSVSGLPATRAKQVTDDFAEQIRSGVQAAGYPLSAPTDTNTAMLTLIVFILVLCLAIAYGPVPAYLVELFPARIRYSSLSLPYHLGTGWFGGLVPTIAVAMVAYKGDVYFGLWFPIIVALISWVVGLLCLPNRRDLDVIDRGRRVHPDIRSTS